ncbi:MAG: hypothetical protein OXF20_03700 [Gammaproteobacteria bacterium]|nr:hypothetical protein [Gammaproteobacteria bacterium]
MCLDFNAWSLSNHHVSVIGATVHGEIVSNAVEYRFGGVGPLRFDFTPVATLIAVSGIIKLQ